MGCPCFFVARSRNVFSAVFLLHVIIRTCFWSEFGVFSLHGIQGKTKHLRENRKVIKSLMVCAVKDFMIPVEGQTLRNYPSTIHACR